MDPIVLGGLSWGRVGTQSAVSVLAYQSQLPEVGKMDLCGELMEVVDLPG